MTLSGTAPLQPLLVKDEDITTPTSRGWMRLDALWKLSGTVAGSDMGTLSQLYFAVLCVYFLGYTSLFCVFVFYPLQDPECPG